MSGPPRVELKSAYSWHCDDCGRENFASVIALDKENHWDEIVSIMGEVECVCGSKFDCFVDLG